MINLEAEKRLLIIRPQGAQGPKIGLAIDNQEEMKRLDEEMGKLNPGQRQEGNNIKKAAAKANIPIVDY